MRASFRDVSRDCAAQGLRVSFAHLPQGETCISGDGQEQRHEREQEQPPEQQQDLEA